MNIVRARPIRPRLDLSPKAQKGRSASERRHSPQPGTPFSPTPPQRFSPHNLTPEPIRRCRSPSPIAKSPGFMDQLTVKPLRRTRSARSASPAVHRSINLTPDHETLIRRSWQRIPKDKFGEILIRDLVNRIGRESFGADATAFERHARHFVDLIQSAVDNLSDVEEALRPWLNILGRGHVGFRIKSKHWDSFGESLMATVSVYIGPGRGHKETIKSWMILSTFLADRLSAASRSTAHSPMVTPRLQLMTFVQP